MQWQKHLTKGITSLGLISNSRFMARLSYWMGGMAGLAPWIRQYKAPCSIFGPLLLLNEKYKALNDKKLS